jgi:hypothetical protein
MGRESGKQETARRRGDCNRLWALILGLRPRLARNGGAAAAPAAWLHKNNSCFRLINNDFRYFHI